MVGIELSRIAHDGDIAIEEVLERDMGKANYKIVRLCTLFASVRNLTKM